jgi:hypothetical protein
MEHQKKKRGVDRSDRNIFIGIGIVCLIGVFVLMYAFNALTVCGCSRVNFELETAIVATNDHISTLLAQTEIAGTEQFNATNTPLP